MQAVKRKISVLLQSVADSISAKTPQDVMEEQYCELLYDVQHFVGSDAELTRSKLLEYLKDVFSVDTSRHEVLLEKARSKKAPEVYLLVEVVDATIYKATDINGLSDPFCILYLASKESKQYTTTTKLRTLTPTWNESFELSVNKPEDEVLCIELWDFDEEESITEKVKRIGQVRNMRGLKLYAKEVIVSGRNRSDSYNELIGTALVPLKSVPVAGEKILCNLERSGKLKTVGVANIHVSFFMEKNSKTAFEQYRYLLYNVIWHEIKSIQDPSSWNGDVSTVAELLLMQYKAQCKIYPDFEHLARWIEYININEHYNFNLLVLLPVLVALAKSLQNNLFTNKEITLFWDAAAKLLPHCLQTVQKIPVLSVSMKMENQPLVVLKLLSQMAELPPSVSRSSEDILKSVVEAVSQGARDWFTQILEKNNLDGSKDEEEQLTCIVSVIDAAMSSLEECFNYYEETFKRCLHFSYAELLYRAYEDSVQKLAEPIVTNVCLLMKPLKFDDNTEGGIYDNDPVTVGTALCLVYTKLKEFAQLGTEICKHSSDLVLPNKFHHWFHPAMVQWLYISKYKTKHWIKKAVELNHCHDCTDCASAFHVLGVCKEIKTFWDELDWPDPQTSHVYLAKIIGDICECMDFYAVTMGERAKDLIGFDPENDKKFNITKEWCLAVKNIRSIQEKFPVFIENFKMSDLITSAAKMHTSWSDEVLEFAMTQYRTLINTTIEECNSKIIQMHETVTEKIVSSARELLLKAAVATEEDNDRDELMQYIDDNLYTAYLHLDPNDCLHIHNIVWQKLCLMIFDIAQDKLQVTFLERVQDLAIRVCSFVTESLICLPCRKQKEDIESMFYKKLLQYTQKFTEYFTKLPLDVEMETVGLTSLNRLLELKVMTTEDLIHQYYLGLLECQRTLQPPKYGQLRVRMQFVEDILRIEILNAWNLQTVCPKGNCNPYVKIFLLPEEKFVDIPVLKTKIQTKTNHPLFDEKFAIQLSKKQRNTEKGLVMFVVKHDVRFGKNMHMAEALQSFDDIPESNSTMKFEELDQVHLPLNCSANQDSDAFKVLKYREDKLGRDFVKMRTWRFPAAD